MGTCAAQPTGPVPTARPPVQPVQVVCSTSQRRTPPPPPAALVRGTLLYYPLVLGLRASRPWGTYASMPTPTLPAARGARARPGDWGRGGESSRSTGRRRRAAARAMYIYIYLPLRQALACVSRRTSARAAASSSCACSSSGVLRLQLVRGRRRGGHEDATDPQLRRAWRGRRRGPGRRRRHHGGASDARPDACSAPRPAPRSYAGSAVRASAADARRGGGRPLVPPPLVLLLGRPRHRPLHLVRVGVRVRVNEGSGLGLTKGWG
eukprot:scaffold35547_cov47-Phaeocystis_antarctica.AAC.1